MKIGLIGYGKMGKLVEQVALQRGHTIAGRMTSMGNGQDLQEAEVCIDFSVPGAVQQNVERFAAQHKNLVIGTTGWYQGLKQIEKIVKKNQTGLFYAPNFSLGMYLFFQMVSYAAKQINLFDEYEIEGCEIHHKHKLDRPSGSAHALIDELLANIKRKKRVVYTREEKQGKDELLFTSIREGDHPGMHEIIFRSVADEIILKHQAYNREGFALGAVKVAEWMHGKTGIFTMEDL